MKEQPVRQPSAWRGRQGYGSESPGDGMVARLQRGFARAGREVGAHPAETLAIIAMAAAMTRLALRREQPFDVALARPIRMRRRFVPIAAMAAICMVMLAQS